jgi:Ribonuclease G/E
LGDAVTLDILYEACPFHTRAALFSKQGRLLSLRFDDPSRPFIEDAVVLGRVRKVAKGLKAAFVDIGDVQDGFLPLGTVPLDEAPLKEGQALMVRITRSADMQKGARLDGRVSLKTPAEQGPVPRLLLPPPNALRRLLQDAGDTPVCCWVPDDRLLAVAQDIIPEDKIYRLDEHPEKDLFAEMDAALEQIQEPSYAIPGGRVTVELTKALAAIDVDAHKLGEKGNDALSVNVAAADEVVRLCRLLDLGGNIIVDFISMQSKKSRDHVRAHLLEQFHTQDPNQVEVFHMSRFGLLEINRERRGAMMPELLRYPAYIAGDILLRLWRQRHKGGEIYVDAASDVVELLKQNLTTDVCLAYLGCPVVLSAREDWPVHRFRMMQNG